MLILYNCEILSIDGDADKELNYIQNITSNGQILSIFIFIMINKQ